jgi:hypothetical protein
MRPGMSLMAIVSTTLEKNQLVIPLAALLNVDSKFFVKTQHQSSNELQEVQLGHSSLTEAVITSGIKAGDVLIIPPTSP